MPEILRKAPGDLAHQVLKRNGPGLEFADRRKRQSIEGAVLLPN
jgi:hypothetical protein